MESLDSAIKKYDLKFDVDKQLDISYGKEYIETHNVTTHKDKDTIFADTRLRKLFQLIMSEGIEARATDILIRPESKFGLVSNRIGRTMVPSRAIHKGAVESLITYIRILVETNSESTRKGVFAKYTFNKEIVDGDNVSYEAFDTRLQFQPSKYGSVVDIRIFYNENLNKDIDDLGFPDLIAYHYKQALKLREGLVIISGPTGSGKTTTEYVGILQILKDSKYTSNIWTIEEPIEYKIDGITQSEVDELHGYTFAEGVKSALRMNPDVMLIGEVRDDETAKTVTRASTSGHLALTTIHANSTLEVLDVLKQYNVHKNDIINAVRLVIFQTLEEKLCPHCRKQKILKPHQKDWLDRKLIGKEQLTTIYERNHEGCEHCNFKGINGRVMLNEMLVTGFEFRVLQELSNGNIDKLKQDLINSEDKLFYPIEWDVHRRIKNGEIDFESATRLIH